MMHMNAVWLVALLSLLSWRAVSSASGKFNARVGIVASSLGDDGNGLQVMITRRMRKILVEDLGYLSAEIDVMEPSVAAVVIERGLARPTNGMPRSWKRNVDPVGRPDNKNPVARLIGTALKLTRGLAKGLVTALGIASTKTLSTAALLLFVPFAYNVVTSEGGITIENIDKAAQSTKGVLGAGAAGVEKGVRKGKAFVKDKVGDKSPSKKSGITFPATKTKTSSIRTASKRKSFGPKRVGIAKARATEPSESSKPPVPLADSGNALTTDRSKSRGSSSRLDIESYESVMDSHNPVEKVRVGLGKVRNSLFSK